MRLNWLCAVVLLTAPVIADAAANETQNDTQKARKRFVVEAFGGLAGLGRSPQIGDDLDLGKTGSAGLGFGFNLSPRIQLRLDGALASWSKDESDSGTVSCISNGGLTICATPYLFKYSDRFTDKVQGKPIFLGSRAFLSAEGRVRPYVELGLLINPLKREFDGSRETSFIDGSRDTETIHSEGSESKLGVAPGLGLEVGLGESFGLTAGARYHFLSNGIDEGDEDEPDYRAKTLDARIGLFLRL
jgi:hypothetical protein